MHDFGAVVYLDVPKTASTYIGAFLKHQMRAPCVALKRHAPVARRVPGTLYFTSVREPLRQYVSLFRFGLEGAGEFREVLDRIGRADLYADPRGEIAAFERWLAFVLAPENAALLGDGYGGDRAALFGFQTWRLLRLAFPASSDALAGPLTAADLIDRYEREALPTRAIRTEHVEADVGALIDVGLAAHLASVPRARRFLARRGAINPSRAGTDVRDATISRELIERVRAREWFIYRRFYPDD